MLLTPSFLGYLDSKLHLFMIPFCSSIITVKARALLAISILFPIQALIHVQLLFSWTLCCWECDLQTSSFDITWEHITKAESRGLPETYKSAFWQDPPGDLCACWSWDVLGWHIFLPELCPSFLRSYETGGSPPHSAPSCHSHPNCWLSLPAAKTSCVSTWCAHRALQLQSTST